MARLAIETVWHPTQQLETEPDGSVLLAMQTRGMNEIARWLAGSSDRELQTGTAGRRRPDAARFRSPSQEG